MKTGIVSLLFPPKCVSCGRLLEFRGFGAEVFSLCPTCKKLWESELLDSCGACGQAISECKCLTVELTRARCIQLRKRVYYLHGKSTSVQNRILFKMKDHPAARAADFLAGEMKKSVDALLADEELDPAQTVLVYLPRSRKKALVSGTDQGKKLADALSERSGIAVVPAICRRRGKEKQQKHLTYGERRKNARETYVLRPRLRLDGKNVILIDDIVTTGSTLAAATRLLRKIGASRIYAVAVAVDDQNKNAELHQPTYRI